MNPKDRNQYRKERLISLLNEKYGGKQIALANDADIAATLVSRYVSGIKGIGEDMVSKIEVNTGNIGWFDIDHNDDLIYFNDEEIHAKAIFKEVEFLSRLKKEKKELSEPLQNSIDEISKFSSVSGKKAAQDLRKIIDEKSRILNILSSKSILSILLDYLSKSGDEDMAGLAKSLMSMIKNGEG